MTTDVGIRQASRAASDLGEMPVWNLGDLYPSPTSAEFQRDLDKAAADAKHMAETYKGKLAGLGRDGPALAGAVKAYEALSDTMGPSTSWGCPRTVRNASVAKSSTTTSNLPKPGRP